MIFVPLSALDLPLAQARAAAIADAIKEQNYLRAETILMEEVNRVTARAAQSPDAAVLLAFVGGVFFLNGEYLNAAIAYQKARAIAPLDDRSRFTLSMSYIRLGRRDWARSELEKLAQEFPTDPLALYWLARLDYDAQQYQTAIAKLQKVIALDPKMMRAWDNLGLCYDYLGNYDEAVKHYRHAIELNRQQSQPSPWPLINLATYLNSKGDVKESESLLREALRYDARLPQAHYQLGVALEKQERYKEAMQALREAAQLDSLYPEPHFLLGRIQQKQGHTKEAQKSFARFQELKNTQRSEPHKQ